MSAPILFAVAACDVQFSHDASFADAAGLMETLNEDERLWTYYSRNLWLLCAGDVANAMKLDGLDFTRRQCVVLTGEDLSRASVTLGRMIEALQNGAAPLGALGGERAACMAQHPACPEDFLPMSAGDDDGDASPQQSAQTFYRYLGSMQHVVDQAIRSRRPFFWACPQSF